MNQYDFNGIFFNAPDAHLIGQARVHHRGCPEANTLDLDGNVREMENFIEKTKDLKSLLDVGACSGLFSVLFTRSPDKRATAIEPSPTGYENLVAVIAANPDRNIRAINEFVGDTDGREVQCSRVYLHIICDNGGGAAWQQKWCGKSLSGDTLTCHEKRIDDLDIGDIDCMKIDVEMYECQVLRGAKKTIEKNRPVIFLEAHLASLAAHGESGESLTNLLHSYGYRIENYDGETVEILKDNSIRRVTCFPI